MRLSLNALPAFRAVAELQNLRAAAERLHLTHSAVSQQIRGRKNSWVSTCSSAAAGASC